MSFISLDKREDAKDLLTEDLNSLLKTAPENKKEVKTIITIMIKRGFNASCSSVFLPDKTATLKNRILY